MLRSAVRLAERRRPAAPPDSVALLAALPVPVILLDAANRIRFINHAAEQFLGVSAAAATQFGLADFLAGDNPLFLLVDQVRQHDARVADHDMALEGPRLKRMNIAVQGAPLAEEPGAVLLVLHDATAARALDRQLTVRGAARSVAGMAASAKSTSKRNVLPPPGVSSMPIVPPISRTSVAEIVRPNPVPP